MVFTVYKSCTKYYPSNYHGITLISCLGKLFNTLVHVRIENEVEKKNFLFQYQAGFRKKYRTTYHIMTLFTLIKKSLREGKHLYACFVDFRKAYDSICKQRLIYEVKEFGLTNNVLQIIKTKYASPKVFLLYEGKISQSFSTKI